MTDFEEWRKEYAEYKKAAIENIVALRDAGLADDDEYDEFVASLEIHELIVKHSYAECEKLHHPEPEPTPEEIWAAYEQPQTPPTTLGDLFARELNNLRHNI